MKKQQGQLNVYQFGTELVKTGDLDPVYIMLWEADMRFSILRKWLLAYWCFYHSGTASFVSDSYNFWEAMREAAGSKDCPRGKERRHFRADNAIKSVEYLSSRGIPSLYKDLEMSAHSVIPVTNNVQTWVGFGPWISFKVADMLERLDIKEIEFDPEDTASLLFDSPRKGVDCLWSSEKFVATFNPAGSNMSRWAIEKICRKLRSLKAPPRYERPIGAQEAETILCKWYSYLNGRYKLGEDINSLRESLKFRPNQISVGLVKAGIKGKLWKS